MEWLLALGIPETDVNGARCPLRRPWHRAPTAAVVFISPMSATSPTIPPRPSDVNGSSRAERSCNAGKLGPACPAHPDFEQI